MRIGPIRIIWIILALLAAFVIFVECLAKTGGGPDPLPRAGANPTPAAKLVTERASAAGWTLVNR